MRTAADISESIRANLRVLDPDISTEPLTPERKIIDTVSEVIAEANVDTYVQDYQFDIDTKVGSDLDKFVALFGFARQGGRSATGTITFSRGTPSPLDVIIPAGTQVVKPATNVSSAVIFQTTAPVTMFVSTLSVDAPIECTVVGPIGNVPAGSITVLGTLGGTNVSSITNALATTGGTAIEDDAALRIRFKNTIFRNIAGTSDQYLALAIASRFANKANIIGPVSRFIEYLQISSGAATSQIPYSKYTFGFDYYLTDGVFTGETFYTPNGADYTLSTAVPPVLTVNNATNLPNGKVVLLEHSYTSKNSRNNPTTNVMNYVDVYVSGQDVTTALESSVFPASTNNLVSTPTTSAYYSQNWVRASNNGATVVGNRFQELMWQPVMELPATITIGSSTYTLNTDYWLVRDVTLNKGSRRARNGIEWSAAVASAQTAGTAFQIQYNFDKLPLSLNELMESHKQITTDVLVHSAIERYLRVALTVMYSPGYSQAAVDTAITTAVSNFLERQQFGAVIQISDILEIAHEVVGVDNVRLTTSTENGTIYGIQELALNGTTVLNTWTGDFTIQDSDLPVLNNIVTIAKSQNTWSTF